MAETTIEFPDDLMARVGAEAAALGMTVDGLIVSLVTEGLARRAETIRTLASHMPVPEPMVVMAHLRPKATGSSDPGGGPDPVWHDGKATADEHRRFMEILYRNAAFGPRTR